MGKPRKNRPRWGDHNHPDPKTTHRDYFHSLRMSMDSIHFFTAKARRKSKCHLCPFPIIAGQKVIGLEQRNQQGWKFANGGKAFSRVYYHHTGCWREQMGRKNNWGGGSFCFVCRKKMSEHGSYTLLVTNSNKTAAATVVPMCDTHQKEPLFGICALCRYYHYAVNLSPLIGQESLNETRMACIFCERRRGDVHTYRSTRTRQETDAKFWRRFMKFRDGLKDEYA